ncbi:hypothetical protein BCR39DRAFT_533034 [Naematelia encephala]|uniref:Uncharacterized protein n=1 Tax=Naematelia encephala TaxID=71784 RepID=A0A1Y2B2X6_9TREE|nr:hypothetical protein BCR39DRAFT_533034 [Naematelia encephala]
MDFGSISSMSGKSSMRRKQSNSLLQALGKSSSSSTSRTSAIPITPVYTTPPTSTSSVFPDDPYSPESPYYGENASSFRAGSSTYNLPLHSARSVSASTVSGSSKDRDEKGKRSAIDGPGASQAIRRPEDVFRVVKDRLFSWSYMMQWYQGEVHWFNTVKISRSTIEAALGPSKVDSRSRNYFLLGASLATLFDIMQVAEYLKALLKVLEEWEHLVEMGGGKGVKNLFRGQRGGKKPAGGVSEMSSMTDGESFLLNVNIPFQPDFFQVHSSTCSIIRDVYKKLLGMVLPSPFPPPPAGAPTPQQPLFQISSEQLSLFHPSTFIHSAILDSPLQPHNPKSPSSGSTHTSASLFPSSAENDTRSASPIMGLAGAAWIDPISLSPGNASSIQQDAFQAMVAGELPPGRTLVGGGQRLTPTVVELFLKVDAKLKRQFSILLREGDLLARKVLDDELALLTSSLTGGAPLKFDYTAALSGTGNGWHGISAGPSAAERIVHEREWMGMMDDVERRERDFGTA